MTDSLTPSRMTDELKPCPCCGGVAVLTNGYATESVWPHGDFHRVFCGACQLRQLFYRTPEEAIAAWNRRPAAVESLTHASMTEIPRYVATDSPEIMQPSPLGAWVLLDDVLAILAAAAGERAPLQGAEAGRAVARKMLANPGMRSILQNLKDGAAGERVDAKPYISDEESKGEYAAESLPPLGERVDANAQDAARYRWLRQQHWNEAPLCVVMQPRQAVKLGHDCPALDRLDAAVDEAMAAAGERVDAPPPSIPRSDFTGEQLRAAYEVSTASVRTAKREKGAGNPPDTPADGNLSDGERVDAPAEPYRANLQSQGYSTNMASPADAPAEPAVLEGYALVPIKPTPAMREVMLDWGTKRSEWEMILRVAAGLPACCAEQRAPSEWSCVCVTPGPNCKPTVAASPADAPQPAKAAGDWWASKLIRFMRDNGKTDAEIGAVLVSAGLAASPSSAASASPATQPLDDFGNPIAYDTNDVDEVTHALTGDEGEEDSLTVLRRFAAYVENVWPGKTAMQVLIELEEAASPATQLAAFAEEVKQLCEDFSSRDGSVYIKDVQAAIDPLLQRYATPDAERELARRELDMAMMIRMLCSHTANDGTRKRAMEMLRKYGLQGSPLRAAVVPEPTKGGA